MYKTRKIIAGFVFCIFLIMYSFSATYATAVAVTDESLNNSLQKFVSSASNDKDYKITVEDNVIKVESKDGGFSFKYNLTNNPTFSYEADINQGMSYEEFEEKTGNLFNVMLGYLAVTDIQGIDFEDAGTYISMAILNKAFSGLNTVDTSNSYIIYDDTDASDVVIFEKNDNSSNIIYASEFGDHAIEYVKSVYKESSTFSDSDELDTFEWTTERKDLTDSSCKLISNLTVKLDSDFSKLQGYSEKIAEKFKEENKENETLNPTTIKTNTDKMEEEKDNKIIIQEPKAEQVSTITTDQTITQKILPKTGNIQTTTIIGIISIFSVVFISLGIKNIKYKDIK